ncbi:hypothetical protein NDU88_004549 [Pleurodeles waltl]|uniref:Uncharacterized protein n=1 Tax=Pleurodeles waltl TaxID=8319 RepID=A0AAV7QD22_PLEWA|nr:hypothetical protein NDU88_004549 [Pleurodeles waltl]
MLSALLQHVCHHLSLRPLSEEAWQGPPTRVPLTTPWRQRNSATGGPWNSSVPSRHHPLLTWWPWPTPLQRHALPDPQQGPPGTARSPSVDRGLSRLSATLCQALGTGFPAYYQGETLLNTPPRPPHG